MWLKAWSLRFYHEEVCSSGGLLDHCVHTVKWSSALPNCSFSLSLSLGFNLHVFSSWCATLCKVIGPRDYKLKLNQLWGNNFFFFPCWLYVIFVVAIEHKLKQATYKWKDGRKDIFQEYTYVGSLLESLHVNKSVQKLSRYIDKHNVVNI